MNLTGKRVSDRAYILSDSINGFLAAHAALNMALDDACGFAMGKNAGHLYGIKRKRGRILQSIGITDDLSDFRREAVQICKSKRIPKIKCDQNNERTLLALSETCVIADSFHTFFAVDFNATLSPEKWKELIAGAVKISGIDKAWRIAEQPTREQDGIHGLIAAKAVSDVFLPNLQIVADEVFVTESDAIELAQAGIALNMKIQKVGGIAQALKLESLANSIRSTPLLVGGTFPTALGRVYDQLAGGVLAHAILPSDGWQPATDWFQNERHLIHESFKLPSPGYSALMRGIGLGFTADWEKIRKFIVPNPEQEYRKVRKTGQGDYLRISPREGQGSYLNLYERLAGRAWNWNLS